MATVLRLTGALISVVLATWAVITIVEANKEIRALCGGFTLGQNLHAAAAILDTGEYLRYGVDSYGGGNLLRVDSLYALGSVRCELHANDSSVVSVRVLERYRMEIVAAWIATVCSVALALFQLLLAGGGRTAGREWGRWAWGGQHQQLNAGMRWASGFASALLIFTILCIWASASGRRPP